MPQEDLSHTVEFGLLLGETLSFSLSLTTKPTPRSN